MQGETKPHFDEKGYPKNELKTARDLLEHKVEERTAELVRLNSLLEEKYAEALRLSDEQYKNVVESLGLGVAAISTKMEVLAINSQMKRWFPDIDLTKKSFCYKVIRFCEDEAPCPDCSPIRTMKDGQIHESLEERLLAGEKRICRIISAPLRDSNSQIIGASVLLEDVTERVKTEEKIRELNEELELKVAKRTEELTAVNQQLERKIFEQTLAVQALRESETRFRGFFENSRDAIALSRQGMHVLVNPAFLEMFGYSDMEELLGLPVTDLVVPAERAKVWEVVTRPEEKTLISSFYETRGLRKDGSEFYMQSHLSGIKLHEEEYILAIIRDVTAKKQVELMLNKRLVYEKMLVEISFRAILAKSVQQFWENCSKVIGQSLDVSRAYVVLQPEGTQRAETVLEWTVPGVPSRQAEPATTGQEEILWLGQELAKNDIVNYPDIIKIPAVEVRKSLINRDIKSFLAVRLIVDGRYYGYIGISENRYYTEWPSEDADILKTMAQIISGMIERQKIERDLHAEKEQLSVTLRSIGDGVITTDLLGRVSIINAVAARITGWVSGEALGQTVDKVFRVVDERTHRPVFGPIRMLAEEGEETGIFGQVSILDREENKKIVYYSCAPIPSGEGNYEGYILVFNDITERKRTEAQLALSQKMESIGLLAAGIAHEINTPMQYISDNTNFIQDSFNSLHTLVEGYRECLVVGSDPKEQGHLQSLREQEEQLDVDYLLSEIPQALQQTKEGIARVTKLVRAMKEFSHPGKREKALADLNRAIEVTATISRNEWKYVADLNLDLDHELPMVNCTIDEINQVVLNMIVNAADAIKRLAEKVGIEAPKGRITIGTRRDGEYVEIMVSDTGEGIAPEIIDKIFDPFFTTKEVGKGTGQGLAIAHDIIVNKHMGLIQVESEPGNGTTFRVCLPANAG